MAVYLKISVSDFLTVFAARPRGPFWSRAPGTLLFAAALVATVASTIIALSWPDGAGASSEDDAMEAITGGLVAVVWIYDIVFFLAQDLLKVLFVKAINAYVGVNEEENKLDEDGEPPESILYFIATLRGRHAGGARHARMKKEDSATAYGVLDDEPDSADLLKGGMPPRSTDESRVMV